jgi:hypothetical protein
VQWAVPTLVKYLVISFTALVATLVLYDVGVRRTAWQPPPSILQSPATRCHHRTAW